MRIISDPEPRARAEAFIPMSSSPRSIEVMNRTIAAIESGEIVQIAAGYLAEHHPDSPDLAAYLAQQDGDED